MKFKRIDMPKLDAPFVREMHNNRYIVVDKINKGYEWVFDDDTVMAIEKLDGTNVSIVIQEGAVIEIYNRTERIPFINKQKQYITNGVLYAKKKGYLEFLGDGQHFGELIGQGVRNSYNLDCSIWIPFTTFSQKHLKYKSWGKYPKDFNSISKWFKELLPLYSSMLGDRNGYVEGVVFTHPDGRMAKLRRNMFAWYFKDRKVKQ